MRAIIFLIFIMFTFSACSDSTPTMEAPYFGAVKNGRVYDLDYNLFGMSAKFNYPEALEALEEILYGKVAE